MQDLKQRIKKISSDFKKIEETLDLKKKEEKLSKLEAKSTDPGLWENQEKARKLMQEIGDISHEVKKIKDLQKELETLNEFVKEGELSSDLENDVKKIEKQVEEFKLSSFLSGEYDAKNAIVSIHAGQGGTEAMDWTSMLYRMYTKYCEKRGWKLQVIDLSSGEEAGIKSVVFKVEGLHAYGYLKGEAGTHRLVRQSPFNADKLRQTSFSLVEVVPEIDEADMPDIEMKDDDLDWQFFRASSQGGQNVQKVSTAVRVKHKPTNIVVTAQRERSQLQNREIALDLLRAKLWVLEQEKKEAEKKGLKGEYKPASWGTQIRSYVLHPYKMVKDLRTEIETADPESVLDGDLDDFIEAELKLSK
ncbi:MAG: peptide chain release factor 2 [Desulfosporosinus sp.]|nr:peptide chain release factor 2 [Desulfosporosinus sp.]